jgi:multiple sugar transport system ATP-binding protein
MANLELKQLKKVYDNGFQAVKNFSLKIEDKEFIILVGPSGCGKTTILRMIAGLETITDGELYIDDLLINKISAKDRNIAMVFQNYALFPHMTVYDNIGFPLKIHKLSKDQIYKKILEVAKILEIEQLLNEKPNTLSGGQKQRVALGRAIVRSPKVFLMDEPLSNLDSKLRTQMRIEIANLHRKLGATFIYVTHDQTEALTMGTRIVVMQDGEIQQVGTPQEVYEKPINIFVAKFIGSPPMNIFDGVVVINEEDIRLKIQIRKDKDSIIYFKLSKNQQDILRNNNYLHKTVKIGIRPESLTLETHEAFNIFRTQVTMVEYLGLDSYIYFDIYGENCVAKIDNKNQTQIGDYILLHADKEKVHLFDCGTGLRIF